MLSENEVMARMEGNDVIIVDTELNHVRIDGGRLLSLAVEVARRMGPIAMYRMLEGIVSSIDIPWASEEEVSELSKAVRKLRPAAHIP